MPLVLLDRLWISACSCSLSGRAVREKGPADADQLHLFRQASTAGFNVSAPSFEVHYGAACIDLRPRGCRDLPAFCGSVRSQPKLTLLSMRFQPFGQSIWCCLESMSPLRATQKDSSPQLMSELANEEDEDEEGEGSASYDLPGEEEVEEEKEEKKEEGTVVMSTRLLWYGV